MIDFPNAPAVGQVFTSGTLSWAWDGSKWVSTTLEAIDYTLLAPVNGETVDLPNTEKIILNPAAALSALTLRFPTGSNKQSYRVSTRQRIDALAITASGGFTVDWVTGELPQNGIIAFTLVQSLNTWVRA